MLCDRIDRGQLNLAIISRSIFVYLALSISIVSASLYDFEDGIGPDWFYDGRVHWHPDDTQSCHGGTSIKSGAIKCTGESSIYRQVEGPADISFWWKKHPSTGPSAKGTAFTFSVNGVVQRTCDFSDWRKESYTIPYNGTYEIRWDFRKITCYPQSEGSGWIDEVNITPERPLSKVAWKEDCTCLSQSLGGINWRGAWEISTTYYKGDIVSHEGSSYVCLENNSVKTPSNANYWGLLAAKGDSGTSHLIELSEDELILYMKFVKDNMNSSKEFRDNNMIIIRIGDDLQEIINNNPRNTTFYLENGYRYVGTININDSMDNITIRSDGRATLDGSGEDFVVGLDNTKNISIENVRIIGGSKCGIAIESSFYCELVENTIEFDEYSGIYINNSKYVISNRNIITTTLQDQRSDNYDNYGISLKNSSYSLIQQNIIDVAGYHVRLSCSYDNIIDTIFNKNFAIYDNGLEYAVSKSSNDDRCRYEHILNKDIRFVKNIRDSYNIWGCR